MKVPFIQTLCAIFMLGAVSITYADEGKDESGTGIESGNYPYEKFQRNGKEKHDGYMEDNARGSYFHEHGLYPS